MEVLVDGSEGAILGAVVVSVVVVVVVAVVVVEYMRFTATGDQTRAR